jgi:hypothetical protein
MSNVPVANEKIEIVQVSEVRCGLRRLWRVLGRMDGNGCAHAGAEQERSGYDAERFHVMPLL